MPYRIQLYVAGDELSKRMLRTIDKITKLLAERFGPRIEASTKDFIAYVLTTNVVPLNLRQGGPDIIHLSIYFALEVYREELKAKFEVTDFPAAKFENAVYVGEEAIEVVSGLHELLRKSHSMSDDELISEMKNLVNQKSAAGGRVIIEGREVSSSSTEMVRPADLLVVGEARGKTAMRASADAKSATRESTSNMAFEGNVIMAGLFECLAKLEKLREEGKIDESTYRKMKEVYDLLLG